MFDTAFSAFSPVQLALFPGKRRAAHTPPPQRMSASMPLSRDPDSSEYVKNIQGKKKKASFECQHCTRKFATRSHLVRHSRVHTGERRYACDYPGCEMRCSRKDNLQQQLVLFSVFLFSFFLFIPLVFPNISLFRIRVPILFQSSQHVCLMVTCLSHIDSRSSNSSYRTHLVVNPRKANAQSALPVDPDTTTSSTSSSTDIPHDFSDPNTLLSPTDVKPITTNSLLSDGPHSNELHSIPVTGNIPHAQTHPPPLGSSLDNNADGPEREWSISPPPLSSAYDYWYVHGCLPHTVRNPASVSGSGSSGATSPEMTNALELAPGQGPRTYVDSPTTYYHPHSIPHGAPAPGGTYGSYDSEGASNGLRTSFPLGTATFPSAADYQHPSATPTSSHQRSHSHSYSGYHQRVGYESASASPLAPHHHHHATGTNGNAIQAQARHSYSTESYEPAAPYSSNGSRALAYNSAPSASQAAAAFHASANSIDGHQQQHHTMQQQPQQPSHSSTFHHGHSHSHSADSHAGFPPPAASDSRPVTRHGSLGGGYSIPVYPSHPHAAIAYGVAVDMPAHAHGHTTYGESPIQRHSMPVSVANSPRVSTSHAHSQQQPQQSPSLVLPPIRYTENEVTLHSAPYGMNSMSHFTNGSGWDRISVSDTRALPPPQGHIGAPNPAAAATGTR